MSFLYNLAPQGKWQEWKQITVGSPLSTYTFTANTTTDIITLSGSPTYATGKVVQFVSTGTLPAPFVDGSTYYLIAVTASTYRVATTIANALANTYINITTAGTGTQTSVSNGQTYLVPLAGGFMYTKKSSDHSVNKTTYLDPEGSTQNTNPIIFDARGQATIYWQINPEDPTDNYYYEIRDENGVLLSAVDDFNASPLEQTSETESVGIQNFVRNSEFYYWKLYDWNALDVQANVSNASSGAYPVGSVQVANEWYFFKTNNNATESISRQTFSPGQTDVPGQPTYFLRWQCTNAGAGGETQKTIYQIYNSVETFNAETVSISFWAKSNVSGLQVTPAIGQQFGSGGSPFVTTSGSTITVTSGWQRYSLTIDVPSVSGKTVGAGNLVQLQLQLPINSTGLIDFSSAQITSGDTLHDYIPSTVEAQLETLAPYSQQNTGEIRIWTDYNNFPATWTSFANGTIGNFSSGASIRANEDTKSLFLMLWTTYADPLCFIYDSTGAKTTRGVSALADFNANKRLKLFQSDNKVIQTQQVAGVGYESVFTADPATELLTLDGASAPQLNLYAATSVFLITTGTLPAPLALATQYYVIPISNTTYKLATSIANAMAGTAINITTAGTGIHTLQTNQNGIGLGVPTGQQYHNMTTAEMPTHTHNIYGNTVTPARATGADSTYEPANVSGSNDTISGPTGSSSQFNVVQPTLTLPYIIKL